MVGTKCNQIALTKSELSAPRQKLIVALQKLNFGQLKNIRIVNGEPDLSVASAIFELHFSKEPLARNELYANDFRLKDCHVVLFKKIDQIGNGIIQQLEVRDGLPFKMLHESKVI